MNFNSMFFTWNEEKNRKLMSKRGVSFEMVVQQIATGNVIATLSHPNIEKYPNQFIFIVELNHYLYCVPFIKQVDKFFLKTIFPSRKATKLYRKNNNE